MSRTGSKHCTTCGREFLPRRDETVCYFCHGRFAAARRQRDIPPEQASLEGVI